VTNNLSIKDEDKIDSDLRKSDKCDWRHNAVPSRAFCDVNLDYCCHICHAVSCLYTCRVLVTAHSFYRASPLKVQCMPLLKTREHWIQRITFAAKTNAACMARRTHTQRDAERHNTFARSAAAIAAKVTNVRVTVTESVILIGSGHHGTKPSSSSVVYTRCQ